MLLRGDFTLLWRKLFRGFNGPDLEGRESYDENAAYDAWMRGRALTDAARDRLRREAGDLTDPPLFSILLHATGDEADVRRSVESVLRQTYPAWELCIAGAIKGLPERCVATLVSGSSLAAPARRPFRRRCRRPRGTTSRSWTPATNWRNTPCRGWLEA